MLRRLALLAAAAVLWLASLAAPAAAHGVAMFPGARTFLCYQDALRDNGQLIAYNPACAAAIAQGGPTPLYNWFAVLRSDAGGRTVGYIPDGQLCSGGTGGPYDFTAFNAARTDWPVTHLTAGANLQFRYSNWAAHPGTFRLYITKDGWDPATPPAWADLESFASVTNPPQSGPPGTLNYYYWNAQLPGGKTGRHLIFIQWVRSDSAENFFSCSDVVFDGGNGEVTGVGPDQGGSTPPTTPPPSTGGDCTATWQDNPTSWPGHFQATITVRNPGTTTLNGWTVRWAFTGGQTFEGAPWNGVVKAQPPNPAVSNATYNGSLAPGATASFGFNGAGTAPSPAPALTCSSP
ncbi:MAG: chitin-binding protein [Nonomuraea sp.]|nr:chitin-binding protein [Nonomuraea sp.]